MKSKASLGIALVCYNIVSVASEHSAVPVHDWTPRLGPAAVSALPVTSEESVDTIGGGVLGFRMELTKSYKYIFCNMSQNSFLTI